MFLLFRDKGITPGEFYRMPRGEKLLITAFVRKIYGMADDKVRLIRGGKR